MKLSELVNYRNQVLALSVDTMISTTQQELAKIDFLVTQFDVVDTAVKQNLDTCHRDLTQALASTQMCLDKIKQQVEQQVVEKSREYFQESTTRYEATINNRDVQQPEYITLDRHLPIKLPESGAQFLKDRLGTYAGWKYPGMIIHPGQESFVDVMVANDPLYLVDDRHELLQPCLQRFNEQFRNRLCQYVITETLDEGEILKPLPNNQFGLILVYNYLNFRPYEVVKRYLKELYAKLRPGGMLILTINDCDRSPGVMLAEQKWCYYTPLNLILDYARSLEFTVVFTWTDGGASTWIELKKSGQLESIRGGQTMAKIIPKIEKPKIDTMPETKESIVPIADLRNQVLALNQYDPNLIRYGFSRQKLEAILDSHGKKNSIKPVAKSK